MGLVENKLLHRVNCTHLTCYLVEVNFLSVFHCERKKSFIRKKQTYKTGAEVDHLLLFSQEQN